MPAPITIWARQSPSTLTTDVGNVKNTFSSWDNCMSEAYCKWPVIIAIVVASLTLLSILFCLARCLCCGAECCCACFSCCNACCPSPRGGRRDRYSKQPQNGYPPAPYLSNQGYQPTPAPVYVAAQPPPPQFATFDSSKVGKPVNEDALPIMPTWDNAQSKKVLDDQKDDDMEMARLDPQQEKAPMLANQAPTPRVGYGELPGSAPGSAHGGEGMPYQQAYTPNSPRTPQSPYATPAQLSGGPVGAGIAGAMAGAAVGGRGGPGGPSRGRGMGGQGMVAQCYDHEENLQSPYAPPIRPPGGPQMGGMVAGAMGGRGRPAGPPVGQGMAGRGYDNNRGRGYDDIGGRVYDNNAGQDFDNNDDGYFPQSSYNRNGSYSQQQQSRLPQQQPAYSSYASSETSTRYEPSTIYGGQESGTVYHSRQAPAPAAFRQQGGGASLPRKPIQDSWREV